MNQTIRILTVIASILLATAILQSCKDESVSPEPQNVGKGTGTGSGNNISVTLNVVPELNSIGKTAQATAIVKDGNGNILTGKTITWSVTDMRPVSISTTGLVTALEPGESRVRATVEGVSAEAMITVGANQNAIAKSIGCLCDPLDYPATTPVVFTAPIMKPEDIATIYPLGYMWKGHVTPIDHQYYYPHNILAVPAKEYPVYAPADGYIVRVARTGTVQLEPGVPPRDNYELLIQHSCDTYTFLTLTTGLTPEMAAAVGSLDRGKGKLTHIKVTAGQQVARVGGQSLDVTIYDAHTPAKKWIVPSHYTEAGKQYATDAFPFYATPVRNALLAKTIRTIEPRGGRFDYDEDGKLAGTWFLKGTNGYAGAPNMGNDYWRGHLVFAYHAFDPAAILVSIGRWYKPGVTDEWARAGWQFSVKGNSPDPKNVTVATGMVKYEVADMTYSLANGSSWDMQTYQGPVYIGAGTVEGVVLVQMMEARLIKVESFPGKTAAQVTGFTAAAQLYER